jgi:hypothetical protein
MDIADFSSKVSEASEEASTFGSKLKSGLTTAAKAGAAAVTAVATAASTAAVGFVKAASDVAEYGDNIDKMSQKLGMSATSYQEWDAVMQHCGTSIDSMQSGMKTLASAAETGNAAFEKLGMSQSEIASMSQEELFSSTITALQNVSDETERTYLAGQLLGKGATELGPLLNTSAEDTQAMKDAVHELGGVMSDEAVAAAATYEDSLQDMQTAISGLKNNIVSEFLPSMSTVMDGLAMIFSGQEGGAEVLQEGISSFVETFTNAIPQVIEIGGQLISSLGGAIVDNLPAIFEGGAEILGQLIAGIISAIPLILEQLPAIIVAIGDGLIAAAPALADAGQSLLEFLANGIVAAIDFVVTAAANVVVAIVDKIGELASKLLEKGKEGITNLANGIASGIATVVAKANEIKTNVINAITTLVSEMLAKGKEVVNNLASGISSGISAVSNAVRNIVQNIKSFFTGLPSELFNIGKNIIQGLINGISSMVSAVANKISSVASSIKNGLKGALGIASPSKWAKGIGQYLIEGLIIGMENSAGELMESADDIVSELKTRLSKVTDFFGVTQDIADLEYDLWELTDGKDATDLEKYSKQIDILNKKTTAQESVVEAAAASYDEMVSLYGENSTESMQYRKQLLQEQISLQKLKDELDEVIESKQKLYDFTSWKQTLTFSDSAIGVSTAATVNSLTSSASGSSSASATINLTTSSGKTMASWLINDLIEVAKSNGTPIANSLA